MAGDHSQPDPAPPADTFSAPGLAAAYADRPRRIVPGFEAMQRMAMLLIAERAPPDARVLVLGAGGGLEMKVFADAQPAWSLDGVDPSAEMLALASRTLGDHAARARLHHGTIETAPEGPFDAATCLLTFHFIAPDDRARTLAEVRRRLRPGAPFVTAHLSVPGGDRVAWLARYEAWLVDSGTDPATAAQARDAVDARTHILSVERDEALLREAGFRDVDLFYAAFAFRGWVATA